ncbi:MAG: NAD-dependent epimerase/dehydratase family protein, partial [Patescibacteria group bacterium]
MKKNIAILGATSHIAKGLIYNFLQSEEFCLHLYARSADKVNDFLVAIGKCEGKDRFIYNGFADFPNRDYDVVINCVGIGTINKHKGDYAAYFTITEEYDNLVIAYLRRNHPKTLYISFSSGAVYGKVFSAPARENTTNCISVNHINKEDYYAIARLNAEAKHRAFADLNIVDLRLFSYFSRFIDLTDGYFITELLSCILKKKVFVTDNQNIIRDYVHPDDLFVVVMKCLAASHINGAFDVMSARPVEKREVADYFVRKYG